MSLALLYKQSPSRSVVSLSLPSSEYKDSGTVCESPLLPSPSSPIFVSQEPGNGNKANEINDKKKRSAETNSTKSNRFRNTNSKALILLEAFSFSAVHQKDQHLYLLDSSSSLYLRRLFDTDSEDSSPLYSQHLSVSSDILTPSSNRNSTHMAPTAHTISSSNALKTILSNENPYNDPSQEKPSNSKRSLETPPHGLLFHPQYGLLHGFQQPIQSQHHFYHHAEPGTSTSDTRSSIVAQSYKSAYGVPILPDLSALKDSKCVGKYQDDTQICKYCQKQYDTPEGYLRVKIGDLISSRYYVQRILGQGTFGTVLGCKDTGDPFARPLAIKIIRNIPKYRRAARTEIKILECLHHPVDVMNNHTVHPSEYCIKMKFWFEYCHHLCMVFPLHKMDIYRYLGKNNFNGFPLKDVQEIGYQILSATKYMHQLRLIHTDIKPENILLKDDAFKVNNGNKQLINNQVLLIDFGSAIHENYYHGEVVSTRHYRAPEIILGLGWSFPCDIWSIGCVLFELFQGTQLFNTHDNLTHLVMMESILGPFPKRMIHSYEERLHNSSSHGQKQIDSSSKSFFNRQYRVEFPDQDTPAIMTHSVNSISKFIDLFSSSEPSHIGILFDLIRKCLKLDPKERITAQDALEHPFFSINIEGT